MLVNDQYDSTLDSNTHPTIPWRVAMSNIQLPIQHPASPSREMIADGIADGASAAAMWSTWLAANVITFTLAGMTRDHAKMKNVYGKSSKVAGCGPIAMRMFQKLSAKSSSRCSRECTHNLLVRKLLRLPCGLSAITGVVRRRLSTTWSQILPA